MTPRQEVLIATVNFMFSKKKTEVDVNDVTTSFVSLHKYFTNQAKKWSEEVSFLTLWKFAGEVNEYLSKGKILDISDFK